MDTPWGVANFRYNITRGFSKVSTPSHGGIALTSKFALNNLSYAAIRRAAIYKGYVFFEEDCDWAIPLYELNKYWDIYFKESKELNTNEKRKEYIQNTLAFANPDYLIEIAESAGAEPAALLKDYMFNNYYSGFPSDDDPKEKKEDFIVSAINLTVITTADGKRHYVTAESYEKQKISKYRNEPKYLSECKLVDDNIFTMSMDDIIRT